MTVDERKKNYKNKTIQQLLLEAELLEEEEKYEEAIQVNKLVLNKESDNLKALLNLAYCYKKIDQFDLMAKYFLEVIKIDFTSIAALKNLGNHYSINYDFKNAIKYYAIIYKLQPDDYYNLVNLGIAYREVNPKDINMSQEKTEKYAYHLFYRAIQLNSNNPMAYKEMIKLFGVQGEYENGLRYLKKVLTLDAEDQDLLELKQKMEILYKITNKLVVIDGSNIAHNGEKKPTLRPLEMLREKLVEMKFKKVTIYCGSGLYKYIDDKEQFNNYRNEGIIISVPAHTDDDMMVINTAIEKRGSIISNDVFAKDNLTKSERRFIRKYRIECSINVKDGIVKLIYPNNIDLTKW